MLPKTNLFFLIGLIHELCDIINSVNRERKLIKATHMMEGGGTRDVVPVHVGRGIRDRGDGNCRLLITNHTETTDTSIRRFLLLSFY